MSKRKAISVICPESYNPQMFISKDVLDQLSQAGPVTLRIGNSYRKLITRPIKEITIKIKKEDYASTINLFAGEDWVAAAEFGSSLHLLPNARIFCGANTRWLYAGEPTINSTDAKMKFNNTVNRYLARAKDQSEEICNCGNSHSLDKSMVFNRRVIDLDIDELRRVVWLFQLQASNRSRAIAFSIGGDR